MAVHYIGQTMYRFEMQPDRIELDALTLTVCKVTPRGVWVRWEVGDFIRSKPKFILNDSRKRYAYETPNAALDSFIARLKRHRMFLQTKLNGVDSHLYEARQLATKYAAVREPACAADCQQVVQA